MNDEVELHRLVTVEAKTEEHRRHLQAEMTQYVVSVAGLISKFESDAPSRRSLGEDPAGVLASRSSTCPANAVRETADAQDLEHDSMLSVLLGVPYSAERDSWAWDTVFQEKETLRGQAEGEMGREISEADGASDEACDGNDAQSNEEDRFSESSAASVASLIRRHLVVDFNHRQAARDFGYAATWSRDSGFGLEHQCIPTASNQRDDSVSPCTSDSQMIADILEFSDHEIVQGNSGENDLASSSTDVQRNSVSEPSHAEIDPVVGRWLEKLGLQNLSHVFAAESIDSMSLALLSHTQLKELGVQRMGDRGKLLRLALQRIHLYSREDASLLTPESGNASLLERLTPPADQPLVHSAVHARTPMAHSEIPIDVAHESGGGKEDGGIPTHAAEETRVPSAARDESSSGERQEAGDEERGAAQEYSTAAPKSNPSPPASQKQESSPVIKRNHWKRGTDTEEEEEMDSENIFMDRMQLHEVERRMDRLEKERGRKAGRHCREHSRGEMGHMSSARASPQGKALSRRHSGAPRRTVVGLCKSLPARSSTSTVRGQEFHPDTDGNPLREAQNLGVAAAPENTAVFGGGLLEPEEVAQDGDLRVALEENRLLHGKMAQYRAQLEESEKRHKDSSEKMALYEGLLNEAASPLSATEAKSSSAQRIRRSLACISHVSVLQEQVKRLHQDKQAIEHRCERAQRDLLEMRRNVHASLEESRALSRDVEACIVELTDKNMILSTQCSLLRAELDKEKQRSQSQVQDAHRKVEVMIKIVGLCCSTVTGLERDVAGLVADITQDLRGQADEMASQRITINGLVEAARREQDKFELEIVDLQQLAENLMWSAGRAADQVGSALTEAWREQGMVSSSHNVQVMELERRVRSANAAVRQCQQNLELKTQHCHRDQLRLGEALAQLDILTYSHKEEIDGMRRDHARAKEEWERRELESADRYKKQHAAQEQKWQEKMQALSAREEMLEQAYVSWKAEVESRMAKELSARQQHLMQCYTNREFELRERERSLFAREEERDFKMVVVPSSPLSRAFLRLGKAVALARRALRQKVLSSTHRCHAVAVLSSAALQSAMLRWTFEVRRRKLLLVIGARLAQKRAAATCFACLSGWCQVAIPASQAQTHADILEGDRHLEKTAQVQQLNCLRDDWRCKFKSGKELWSPARDTHLQTRASEPREQMRWGSSHSRADSKMEDSAHLDFLEPGVEWRPVPVPRDSESGVPLKIFD